MTKARQLLLLILSCPLFGVVYALAALASAILVYEPFGQFLSTFRHAALDAGKYGAILGTFSLIYVFPLLAGTEYHRSVPRVFLGTLAAAALSGPTLLFAPIITFVIHLVLCAVEERRAMKRGVGVCPTCHYPLAGLPTHICPECGTNTSLPRPE